MLNAELREESEGFETALPRLPGESVHDVGVDVPEACSTRGIERGEEIPAGMDAAYAPEHEIVRALEPEGEAVYARREELIELFGSRGFGIGLAGAGIGN